jgi:hypothetical protein
MTETIVLTFYKDEELGEMCGWVEFPASLAPAICDNKITCGRNVAGTLPA